MSPRGPAADRVLLDDPWPVEGRVPSTPAATGMADAESAWPKPEKFRVWAEQTEGERPIWVPISDLFATLQHARAWCRHLNREFKIEPEEAEDD